MFCLSLPKVALVKSISLVKTKKINLMNMLGGCGWKNVNLSQDLSLQFFFKAKNENLCQDSNLGLQKGNNLQSSALPLSHQNTYCLIQKFFIKLYAYRDDMKG